MFNFNKWLKEAFDGAKGIEPGLSMLEFSLRIHEPYSVVLQVLHDKREITSLHVMHRYIVKTIVAFPKLKLSNPLGE